jgi:hypothetical protein
MFFPSRFHRTEEEKELELAERKVWDKCCELLDTEGCQEGTMKYQETMNLFVPTIENLKPGKGVTWTFCCRSFNDDFYGYHYDGYPKRGTFHYNQVMKLYLKFNDPQTESYAEAIIEKYKK